MRLMISFNRLCLCFRNENTEMAPAVSVIEFQDAFKQKLEFDYELGHTATIRETPTEDGFTHDWTMFLRTSDVKRFQQYVTKVVFVLHETFTNPERSMCAYFSITALIVFNLTQAICPFRFTVLLCADECCKMR